ncbi:hypothetical protein DOY81_011005, partial [Sarcophaga bullata]
YTSTNVDKTTTSIRSKAKAEFLENLNAKLAKQSLSGRAFAVRNLINSKALMYQITDKLKRPSVQYRNLPLFDTNTSLPPLSPMKHYKQNLKQKPDPRICHESLMDQIKRGATLKRNQKINDRSAPKIY